MKVLITGSRTWDDEAVIFEALKRFPDGTDFIVGDADGADEIAASIIKNDYGKSRRWRLHNHGQYQANWKRYGAAAGPIRNYEMIKQKPDEAVAFKKGETPGTNHMIKLLQDYFKSRGDSPGIQSSNANWYSGEDASVIFKTYVSS